MKRHLIFIAMMISLLAGYSYKPSDTMYLHKFRQFHFNYANDVYNRTDRYLTQIASIGLYTPYKIDKQLRPFRNAYSLEQRVYTPSDIFGDSIQRNDRPYASTLTIDLMHCLFYERNKTNLNLGLTLGTFGKPAFGEQMQREVHYAVNSRQALGWKYQLASAPFLNFLIGIEKGLINIKNLDYILKGTANTGNIFNHFTIGQELRLHRHDHYFQYMNHSKLNTWRLSFSMKNDLKLVAYNGTLQGAIGSSNNQYALTQKEISPIVFQNQFLIYLGFRKMQLTLSKTFLSKEFSAGLNHQWTAINICHIF